MIDLIILGELVLNKEQAKKTCSATPLSSVASLVTAVHDENVARGTTI